MPVPGQPDHKRIHGAQQSYSNYEFLRKSTVRRKLDGMEGELELEVAPSTATGPAPLSIPGEVNADPTKAGEHPPEEAVPEPVSYPLKITYCGNCGLPPEYCEYFPDFEKCRQWLEANLPNQLGDVNLGSTNEEDLKKGRQKRGGKGLVKTKKSEKKGPTRICLSRAPRGKKKSVTVITGLGSAGIDLKVAAKYFGTKFACGSSVTGDDEIVIQGDVKDDLFDLLPEKWPEIDEDCIEDLGDQKR